MMDNNLSDKYMAYARPLLSEQLRVVRLDKSFHRAEGDSLYYYDEKQNEKRVIDFIGGFGASLFGHNNKVLIAEAMHCLESNIPFNSQASVRLYTPMLCEKLNRFMFQRFKKKYIITLASSGAEIVESAIKHAELFLRRKLENIQNNIHAVSSTISRNFTDQLMIDTSCEPFLYKCHPKKTQIEAVLGAIASSNKSQFRRPPLLLSLRHGFHGKTTGALSLTYMSVFRDPFDRLGENVKFMDHSSIDEDEYAEIIRSHRVSYYQPSLKNGRLSVVKKNFLNVACFFLEPLQGEGGINPVPKNVYNYIRTWTRMHGVPLIVDEIQCGMGRTGTFLFSEQYDEPGDYYLLSKSLGGGLAKISALLIPKDMYIKDFGLWHTSTFGEDDYSSCVALKALSLLEKDRGRLLMNNCRVMGDYLKTGLQDIQKKFPEIIVEIRGVGLMLGIQLASHRCSGSPFLRMLSKTGQLGYIVAGYLFHEHSVRVAPALGQRDVIRVEPSAYINHSDCDQLIKAVSHMAEALHKQNFYHLCKYMVGLEKTDRGHDIKSYRRSSIRAEKIERQQFKVGFIGHVLRAEDMKEIDCGFSEFTSEELETMADLMSQFSAPVVIQKHIIKSLQDSEIDFLFIGMPFTTKWITEAVQKRKAHLIIEKIKDAVELSAAYGCRLTGLGGFTSIVTNNGLRIKTNSVCLTSGNSLTVWMGLQAMFKEMTINGYDPSGQCFAAIGATGNIARMYCRGMSERVAKLILIGRPNAKQRLKTLAASLYGHAFSKLWRYVNKTSVRCGNSPSTLNGVAGSIRETAVVRELLQQPYKSTGIEFESKLYERLSQEMGAEAPIRFSSRIKDVREADLILSASSSAVPLIFPNMIKKNGKVIICDIAVPSDVDDSIEKECSNVKVIKGGVVKLPFNQDFQINGIRLDPGTTYACLSETMLLGFENFQGHFSYGRLEWEKVEKIAALAEQHGFQLAGMNTGTGL